MNEAWLYPLAVAMYETVVWYSLQAVSNTQTCARAWVRWVTRAVHNG